MQRDEAEVEAVAEMAASAPAPAPPITPAVVVRHEVEVETVTSLLPEILEPMEKVPPHWSDRYLVPLQPADLLPERAVADEAITQPEVEMFAPASWMLGIEPMPMVDESREATDESLVFHPSPDVASLDMDAAPVQEAWSQPTARVAAVAAIPDEIELPAYHTEGDAEVSVPFAPSLLASESLSLGKLLWSQLQAKGEASRDDEDALTALTPLPMLDWATVNAANLPPKAGVAEPELDDNAAPQAAEESPGHGIGDDTHFNPQMFTSLGAQVSPVPLPGHLQSVRPSVLTSLGVCPLVQGEPTSFTVLPESELSGGRTVLPSPRPKSVIPKSIVATGGNIGLSAASKAMNLSLPTYAVEVPRAGPAQNEALPPPPPRTVPRAPVTVPHSQPGRKASAWLGFWK